MDFGLLMAHKGCCSLAVPGEKTGTEVKREFQDYRKKKKKDSFITRHMAPVNCSAAAVSVVWMIKMKKILFKMK